MQLFSFSHPSGAKVVFEDDDRCAYAYLLETAGNIVGDVWIYNSDFTPENREWNGESEPPYRNASEYVQNHPFPRVENEDEITVSFDDESDGAVQPSASVYIRDRLAAILKPGARPGWSANARLDGPVALRLRGGS